MKKLPAGHSGVGAEVGAIVGVAVGDAGGNAVGAPVGATVGLAVGAAVGLVVGLGVGLAVAHWRSLVTVGAAVTNSSALHVPRTGWHALLSKLAEKVAACWHGAQAAAL